MKKAVLCLLLFLSFFSSGKISAQVHFVDIPDLNSNLFDLDLDSNGVNDFTFYAACGWFSSQISFCYYNIGSLNVDSNAFGGFISPGGDPLNQGTVIGPNLPYWSYSNFQSIQDVYMGNPAGTWANAGEKFLGVRFLIDSTIHYGWIRMSLPYSAFLIKDWAYEEQPDSSIIAGEGWLASVPENNSDQPVSFVQSGNTIRIHSSDAAEYRFSIYDITGQVLFIQENVRSGNEIMLPELATGIYIVELYSVNSSYRTKMLLNGTD